MLVFRIKHPLHFLHSIYFPFHPMDTAHLHIKEHHSLPSEYAPEHIYHPSIYSHSHMKQTHLWLLTPVSYFYHNEISIVLLKTFCSCLSHLLHPSPYHRHLLPPVCLQTLYGLNVPEVCSVHKIEDF